MSPKMRVKPAERAPPTAEGRQPARRSRHAGGMICALWLGSGGPCWRLVTEAGATVRIVFRIEQQGFL